jgi:hypothetical protein
MRAVLRYFRELHLRLAKGSARMINMEASLKVLDGLLKDPITGEYRVLPGYSHQTLRYAINETWLDEDDNLWVKASAVEREIKKEHQGQK